VPEIPLEQTVALSSKKAVFAALAGNSFLTVIKFIAFLISGSGAMLSESIHSLADAANQFLLFLGIQKSERPADATFHYGYGAERFFFALMSAIGIFVLGCGVTVYHGIHTLLNPHELHVEWFVPVVLAVSLVVDGVVMVMAIQSVWHKKGDLGFIEYLRNSSDPTVLAVLFEDGVATLGVILAAVGIGLSVLTHNPMWDSFASIAIGLLLGMVAFWLAAKNRELLLGPAVQPAIHDEILHFLRAQPAVGGLHEVRTRILGADRFRLQADIDFNGRYLGRGLEDWIRERLPDPGDPEAVRSFAEEVGEQLMEAHATEIDRMEKELRERFPHLAYVDIEGD
jgi:zinc transporter 9